jgi:hypothetical protein
MATKVDAVAARRRQQIIVLAVGGLLLAGLVMLQAPKVLNHGKKSSTTSASTSTSSGTEPTTSDTTTTPTDSGSTTGATTTPSTTTPVAPPVIANGPATKVAGVIVRSAGAPRPDTGQLWSLTRFKVRDPFVQQVSDKSATAASSGTAGSTGSTTGANGSAAPAAAAGAGAKAGAGSTNAVVPTTVTPAAIAYLTLMVNGNAQQLTLKDVFPKGQPTFVVRNVAKNIVTIGVAGGRFVGGAVVKLQLGKAVTLMNTATGQRFVMKLVYTGSQPEQIAGFKTPGVASATTPAVTAPATTADSTAAPKA